MHEHQGKCSSKCRYNEPSGPGVLPSLSSIQSITAKDNKTDIRQIDYCCALPCEVKHQVYVKRQTRICNTWLGFPHYLSFTVHFFLHKLIVSSKFFLSITIVFSCFYLFIFYFEKFSTWIWCLPFVVYVKLKLSTNFAFNFEKLKDFGLIFFVSCWKPFVLVYLTMYSCYATTINNARSMLTCHTHSSIDLVQVDVPFLAAKGRPRATKSREVAIWNPTKDFFERLIHRVHFMSF